MTVPESSEAAFDGNQPKDPRIGTVLDDKLAIQRVLGRGGMGVVYLARQLSMDREVAVKVLHPHAVADQDSILRFLHEAKVASKLRHPNIITVFDFGQTPHDGVLYLVMELLSGAELAKVVEKEGALPPARVVHIMTQVCDAVHHAHLAGLVHRDLKPENVFLTDGSSLRGDFVKVLDFGIARAQAVEGADRITRTGVMCGTPAYMSPEQIMGDSVDARSDIYSLGIMLFELLTGSLPFLADTQMRLLMAHLESPVPSLEEAGPGIPPALYAVVKRALAKKREDRQTTALQLANELVEALDAARRESDFDVDAVVLGAAPARAGVSAAATVPGPSSSAPNTGPPVAAGRGSRDTIEPLDRQRAVGTTRKASRRGRNWIIAAGAGVAIGVAALVAVQAGKEDGDTAAGPAVAVVPSVAVPDDPVAPAPTTTTTTASEQGMAALGREPPPSPEPQKEPQAEPAPAEPTAQDGQVEQDEPPAPAPAPTIAVTSEPRGALVTLDGEPMGTTPLALPRPKGDAKAKVEIKLAGFQTVDLELAADAADVDLVLDKRKRPATPSAHEAGAGKATPTPGATSKAGSGEPKATGNKPKDGARDGAGLIE